MRNSTLLIAILATLLCVSAALAQNTSSGDIRGTVMDNSGAVVPGVTVTVENVDTGVTTFYKTNGAGLYDTGPIITGNYTITFKKTGFETFVRGPISLGVGTLTINGALKVGSVTQKVQVSAKAPLLQTESGSQSSKLTGNTMQQLPNFANWENFIVLAPGVAGSPTGGYGMNPGQTASVNGNAVFYNVLGDGVTMSFPSNGNSYDYNFDTLAEVDMQTSTFSAQYENGGVVYNQISKSGTSHYHGDVFDYFSNNALNAAPFGFGQYETAPVLHANYFGGSLGGPVPGKLKKKLFFFFNYDYSQYSGGSSTGFLTVPTAQMLNGDFTGQPTIYDPTTQTVDSSGVLHRTSFASEYGGGNVIPPSMISPVAQAMQAFFPKANVANPTVTNGITTNNYFYSVPVNSPSWSYFWRADYNLSQNNRIMVNNFYNKANQVNWETSPDCPINCTNVLSSASTAQIADVFTFSPRAVNEFRIGLTTQQNLFLPQTVGQGYPAKLGLKSAKADIFPEVNFTGACCWALGPGTNAIQHQVMIVPSDVLTMIKGRHVLHFGGEYLDQQINTTSWGNVDAGNFTFNGAYTNSTQGDFSTGVPYADFLLGYVNSWSATNIPEFYPRMNSVQLFAQDDFKVRPNLTLNIGVRWEGWEGISEKYGNELSFDPNIVNPAVDPLGNANTLGAMWYATTKANGRTKTLAPTWNTFLPRFGFSWQLKPNTVLRGGVGLYAYNFNEGDVYGNVGFAFGQSGNENDATNGVLPVLLLNQDGSVNNQGAAGASINSLYLNAPDQPDSYNGQSVPWQKYHAPVSKIWQYNLTVQRELNPNLVLDVAYVGSHGFDQMFYRDLNQIPENLLGPNDTSGSTNARPYPNFQSIGGWQRIGVSNYNALQVTLQKRMTQGLQFNVNYTWSKYLDMAEPCAWNCAVFYVQNTYQPWRNYGPSAFDIPHMFKGYVIYQLPVGQGKRYLNNRSFLSQALGGWQTSATIQWQAGNAFTPTMANDNSYSQAGSQFPNLVGNPYSGPHGTLNQWFNVAAFAQPAPGTYGNLGRGTLRGPGLANVDFSLGKNFPLTEKVKLQIRADASNIFNHPNFGLPDSTIGPGHTGQITSTTLGQRSIQLLGRISF